VNKICIDCGYGMNKEIFGLIKTLEEENNLAIGEKVREKLMALRFNVYMIRTNNDYLPIKERIRRIEDSGAEVAIIIDPNWSENPNQKGIETYYGDGGIFGELLAKKIQKELVTSTHLYNRGFLRSSDKAQEDIFLLTNCKVTTIVTLLGFFSNPYERKLLLGERFRENISTAMVKGICKYFDIKKSPLGY
jgi:N-acetylmuramoyl-L-alanine amidase